MAEEIINPEYLRKYPEMIEMLQKLRFSDEEIDDLLTEYDELMGWEPITFQELRMMEESEWKELKSYCWKYGEPRCQCVGITNVKFSQGKIEYSDSNGDPTLYPGSDLTEKIHKVGGEKWAYGLYRRVK